MGMYWDGSPKYRTSSINAQCWLIQINYSQYFSMSVNFNQCGHFQSMPYQIYLILHWSALIWHWSALVGINISLAWLALIGNDLHLFWETPKESLVSNLVTRYGNNISSPTVINYYAILITAYLSESNPQTRVPTPLAAMKNPEVCLASAVLSHTKSHSVTIVDSYRSLE